MSKRELKDGDSAPAVRVKRVDGSENVIGSMSNGIQIVYRAQSEDEFLKVANIFKSEFIDNKLIPTIVVPFKFEMFDDFETNNIIVAIDFKEDFKKRYSDRFYLIDEDGVIIYRGEFDIDLCKELLSAQKSEKSKKHSHENWMRT